MAPAAPTCCSDKALTRQPMQASVSLTHSAWQTAHCIFAFVPRSDEPDILPLLRSALAEGKTLALPQFEKNSGIYRGAIIRDFNNDLSPGHYGIPEPVAHCTGLENQSVDLTLVPGMAFDSQGWRLGRGKGFYDRLLPSISGQRCGVAFDHQWVESVPHEPLDQKMDWIITPHRWVKARKDV